MRISWIMAGGMLLTSLVFTGYSDASSTQGDQSAAKTAAVSKHHHKVRHKHRRKIRKAAHRRETVGAGGLPRLQSSAAMVFDEDDSKALFTKNPGVSQPIASITKLMTAMVLLDANLPGDEKITVTEADVDTLRNSSSRLRVGTTLSRREMLRLALMSSENRAAFALARTYPGGTQAFVAAMNRKAAQLGMRHTHFVDPTGLHSDNVSTAADLVELVKAGYRYQTIRNFTTTASYDVDVRGRRHSVEFRNTNALVRNKNSRWHIGLSKTGYINESGRCLVMHANIANKSLIIVLLDSWGRDSRIGDANRIKRWIENTTVSRYSRGGNGVS